MAQQRSAIGLYALTLGAFAIGTTEFVPVGLLPEIAHDLHVSIPAAGFLVTGYALGVAIGGPAFTLALSRVNRKTVLMLMLLFFIAGNGIAAVGLGGRRRMNRLHVRIAVSEAAAWTARRFYGGRYRIIPNGVHLDHELGPADASAVSGEGVSCSIISTCGTSCVVGIR